MEDTSVAVVLSTAPSTEIATEISRTLVEEGLVACANVLPPMLSIYRWKDAIQSEPEVQMILKTAVTRIPELRERLTVLHPYDVPEFLELDVAGGLPQYLAWIGTSTTT
ncbi:MAG: divalent-cation tolerance protein CutA ['Candidatus Kapabacteria' thiocyanatum]|uniref:Divalent-cation tolerance protein CutA n=1 Tax=Candidatus Kapaibacterium thiocyanatum TaxID=1895771 RepID=A0A1M3L3W3_9BACT|nr:divalent-cation tolerance protein CutA ['Candidatus Kapabacteria' thiocyanatum]OJX60031.1 MAG: hypothetical protein BGO89_08570 ['Candidatus Kapabacteria' thiocyanatum]